MHRIIMYADTSSEGLLKMENELIENLDSNEPELNLEWVSWQLEHEAVALEDKFKILYFLINESKITLTAVKKVQLKNIKEKEEMLKIQSSDIELFNSIKKQIPESGFPLDNDDYREMYRIFKCL